jgi:phosphate uptake regulator
MKRSIVKHGPSTYTISLPAKWVKENNLRSGLTVDVQQKGNRLEVSTKKKDETISLEVDIKDNLKIGKRYIVSAHRKGCDELTLCYSDPLYLKKIEECLSEDVLGYEIVKQGPHFCNIRDIPGTKFREFDILFERIWMILLSMAEDITKAIIEKDFSVLESIQSLDKRINKFTNFCIRILQKRSHPDYRNIPVYYRFLRSLEELGDSYKYLMRYCAEERFAVSVEFIDLVKKENEYMKKFHKAFYSPKDRTINSLLLDVSASGIEIAEFTEKKESGMHTSILFMINDKIRSMISAIIELNIIKD